MDKFDETEPYTPEQQQKSLKEHTDYQKKILFEQDYKKKQEELTEVRKFMVKNLRLKRKELEKKEFRKKKRQEHED